MADVIARPEAARAMPAAPWAAATRKYAAEAIGTFFLVFTVAASGLSHSAFTPLAAGAVLMVMIYAGGHISGGHYNPAVTMAALCRRRIGLRDAAWYWVVQLVAGLVAAVVARAIVNPAAVTTLHPAGHALTAAALVELLFTFALCWVMLNVATSKDQPVNSFYGLAIGFTVAAGAFAVGGISGGAFNPAVALGTSAAGLFAWSTLWIYLVVQVVAGAEAGSPTPSSHAKPPNWSATPPPNSSTTIPAGSSGSAACRGTTEGRASTRNCSTSVRCSTTRTGARGWSG